MRNLSKKLNCTMGGALKKSGHHQPKANFYKIFYRMNDKSALKNKIKRKPSGTSMIDPASTLTTSINTLRGSGQPSLSQ